MWNAEDLEYNSTLRDPGKPAPFDPTFKGPIEKREFTDTTCCCLTTLVILGYAIMGIFAWLYGDPRHVLYPRNSTGWFCGIGPNKDRPSLFYFDIRKCATALNGSECLTTQVCVEKCPSSFWAVGTPSYLPNVKPDSVFNQSLCVPSLHLGNTNLTVQDIVDKELCPFIHVPSTSVLGRCLPDVAALGKIPSEFSNIPGLPSSVKDTVDLIKNGTGKILSRFNTSDTTVQISVDLASSWPWILAGLLAAVVLSMLLLLLLIFPAKVMLILVTYMGALIFFAHGIWHLNNEYEKTSASIFDIGLTINVFLYLNGHETWLVFLVILCAYELVWLLQILGSVFRIHITVALIKESSKAIGRMMSTLLYPLVTFVLLLVCVAYWGSTALCLATSGTPIYRVVALDSAMSGCQAVRGTKNCDPQNFASTDYPECPSARCIFIKHDDGGHLQRNMYPLMYFSMFTFFWCVNFILALGQCSLAAAFASYYWARNKPEDVPSFPLWGGFVRSIRYHPTSLLLGAYILLLETLVKPFQYVVRLLGCYCGMPLCPDTYFSRNNYTMMAIYGENYRISHANVNKLLGRNVIGARFLGNLTELMFYCFKLLVAGVVGVLSFLFFSGRMLLPGSTFHSDALHNHWTPTIAVVFGSYIIADVFFSVYNVCLDTFLLCFVEDVERNDGSEEQPWYMSEDVLKYFEKTNKEYRRSPSPSSSSSSSSSPGLCTLLYAV